MDTIMKPEVWPEGVSVSEFRHWIKVVSVGNKSIPSFRASKET